MSAKERSTSLRASLVEGLLCAKHCAMLGFRSDRQMRLVLSRILHSNAGKGRKEGRKEGGREGNEETIGNVSE